MEQLLSLILSVIAFGTGACYPKPVMVNFNDLPAECQAAFDKEIVENGEWRKGRELETFKIDMDGDKSPEYFIYDGSYGGGGVGWLIFTRDGDKWRKVDSCFGNISFVQHDGKNGLLVAHGQGCDGAAWQYSELLNGKLQPYFDLDATYGEPVRQKLTQLKIKYYDLPINIVQYDVAGANPRAEVWCGGKKVFECKTRHALGVMKPLGEPYGGDQRFAFDWAYREKGSDYRDCVVDLKGNGDKRYLILVDANYGNAGPEVGYLLDVKDDFRLVGEVPVGETYDYPIPNPEFVFTFYEKINYFGCLGSGVITAKIKIGDGKPEYVGKRRKNFPFRKIAERNPDIRHASLNSLYCDLASDGWLKHAKEYALKAGFTQDEIDTHGAETLKLIQRSRLWKYLAPLNQME